MVYDSGTFLGDEWLQDSIIASELVINGTYVAESCDIIRSVYVCTSNVIDALESWYYYNMLHEDRGDY
jgi:hypothetical protein